VKFTTKFEFKLKSKKEKENIKENKKEKGKEIEKHVLGQNLCRPTFSSTAWPGQPPRTCADR
jgi:hypothetical protein